MSGSTVRARILVVDDDATTLSALRRLLSSEGLVVECCASAETALDALRDREHDALLTDWVMPRIDGAELVVAAKRIRPTIRCLIMSGHARPNGVDETVAWLTKPLDLDALLDSLEAI